MRLLGRILYWAAVLAIAILLLVLLVRYFESRDPTQVGRGAAALGAAV